MNGLGGLYAFELGLEAPQEEPPELLSNPRSLQSRWGCGGCHVLRLSHPLPQLDPIPSEKLEDMFLRKATRFAVRVSQIG